MSLPAPAHVHQLDGSAWGPSGCMGAAAAMAMDAYTRGAIRPGMQAIRNAQDDKDGGIGLDDVATAWRRGWGLPFEYGPSSWAAIRRRLAAGDGVVVTVNYAALGGYRAPGSRFTGAHALYLQRLANVSQGDGGMIGTAGVVVNDPLRRASAVLPERMVQLAYTGGAGWGSGVYRGTASAASSDGAKREQALELLRRAGVATSPDSYVFSRADAVRICERLYKIPESAGIAGPIIDRWTGKTVADWIAASSSTGYDLAEAPLAGIARALEDLPDTLSRGALVAGVIALALLGVVLTFREPLSIALPAPVRRVARA